MLERRIQVRIRRRFAILGVAVCMVAAGCSGGAATPSVPSQAPAASGAAAPAGGADAANAAFPRNETLYTSGTQWGPPANWNPLRTWDSATGTKGLVYETLFLYDTQEGQFTPWLAESGTWTDDKTYELKLRQGVTWADGKPFSADDVVFTVELGKMKTVPYANLWTWLEKAEAVDPNTVKFTFSKAKHQQWANWIYNNAIVPKHIWEGAFRGRRDERRQREAGRHRAVHLPQPRPGPDGLGQARRLVGHGGTGQGRQAQVRRRHRQLQQRGGDGPAAAEGPGPQQQLPARRGQPGQG